jgi:hypothetical protein
MEHAIQRPPTKIEIKVDGKRKNIIHYARYIELKHNGDIYMEVFKNDAFENIIIKKEKKHVRQNRKTIPQADK